MLTGGAGTDSYWCDAEGSERIADVEASETAGATIHRISGFQNGASREINGSRIADPGLTAAAYAYKQIDGNPLFSAEGPAVDDVRQGAVGDCYYLAGLAATVQKNPAVVRNAIVDLGDGTYAVRFYSGSTEKYYRVDNDVPVFANTSTPAYAKFGASNSMWVVMMEKGWAMFRRGADTYASIEAGWPSEAFASLRRSSTGFYVSQKTSGQELARVIVNDYKAGKSVTLATAVKQPANGKLIANHAYVVVGLTTDQQGNLLGLRLRNPWGVDGGSSNDGANDGYVTLSAADVLPSLIVGVESGTI